MTSKPRVGFIGLGLMGYGIATNILAKGYPLSCTARRNRAPLEDLVSKGAVEATSIESLARTCDIIFLCLTGSPEVAEVVAHLKPGLAKGSVVVDCSTGEPTVTERLAAELAEVGVQYADAPLGRTPKFRRQPLRSTRPSTYRNSGGPYRTFLVAIPDCRSGRIVRRRSVGVSVRPD